MIKASRDSQLGTAVCAAEDTEEMFWLRQSDDAQSRIALGSRLAAQYRFRDAEKAFESALAIRSDDPSVYLRLGGTRLTLLDFDGARDAYDRALRYGISEKALSYPLGVWHYLRGAYEDAAARFAGCLPCDDETAIAVLYWHCLCRMRAGQPLDLIEKRRALADVGHHTAYQQAVALFAGEETPDALSASLREAGDLDYVIAAYGLCCCLARSGRTAESRQVLGQILEKESVWPCISYLAAWNDSRNDRGQ